MPKHVLQWGPEFKIVMQLIDIQGSRLMGSKSTQNMSTDPRGPDTDTFPNDIIYYIFNIKYSFKSNKLLTLQFLWPDQ